MLDKINKTALDIEVAHKRGFIHRDYMAHCLRWSFALRHIKRGMKVLDVGCGNGIFAQVLYTNMYKPELYVGVDIRGSVLKKMKERKTNFRKESWLSDIRFDNYHPDYENYFDLVVCFEVIEHFTVDYIDHVLSEIKKVLKPRGILLLSTPNYDLVHKAKNHIHEYREGELEGFLGKYFEIERKIGTFASQKDILPVMDGYEKLFFERLKTWFDPNVLSVIFASLHPSQSRNILWICKKSEGNYIKDRQQSLV